MCEKKRVGSGGGCVVAKGNEITLSGGTSVVGDRWSEGLSFG